jgi:peroxiredoxin
MRHLQKFHEKYGDKGLVLLGFNSADHKQIALDFFRENGARFPTILDNSRAAQKVSYLDYKASGVPVNYIIDREGKIVGGWYDNDEGYKRVLTALKKAGLKTDEP